MLCSSCSSIFENYFSFRYQKIELGGVVLKHYWFFNYQEIKPIVLQAKYKKNFIHLKHISRLSAAAFSAHLQSSPFEIMTYIPSSNSRVNKRGFDHGRIIANEFSKVLSIPTKNLLAQTTHFQQTLSSRQERISAPNYVLTKRPDEGRWLIIDDIATTRSSLRAAHLALRKAGYFDISALTLGH